MALHVDGPGFECEVALHAKDEKQSFGFGNPPLFRRKVEVRRVSRTLLLLCGETLTMGKESGAVVGQSRSHVKAERSIRMAGDTDFASFPTAILASAWFEGCDRSR